MNKSFILHQIKNRIVNKPKRGGQKKAASPLIKN